ncbi:MAG: hypothetical protein WC702_00315 [Patescibacteria group bacterium]|jgi:hypothetical protein
MSEGNFIRESGVTRVVDVSDEDERNFLEIFRDKFQGEVKESLEIEKTPEILELINDFNKNLKQFFQRYGVEWMEVPAGNIHLLDLSSLSEEQKTRIKFDGSFKSIVQHLVLIDYSDKDFSALAVTLVHEMIHFNSFQSWQKGQRGAESLPMTNKETNEKLFLNQRRQGINVFDVNGRSFFREIDEAVVTELAIEFDQEFFSKTKGLKDEVALRDQIFSEAAPDPSKRRLVRKIIEHPENEEDRRFQIFSYKYGEERKKFWEIVKEIFEKNRDEFTTEEDVFNLFVQACMTGRLLPLARIYEKTFGPGSFRKLGEETKK